MELYFLRHAIAVDRGTPGHEDDSRRPLTAEGRKKMRRGAKGMKALGLSFDWIFSSPFLRAKDTAKIVARILKLERRLKFSEHLAAGGDPKLLIRQLARLPGTPQRLLLVGHEPDLSQLVALLVGGQKTVSLRLRKGGLCRLDTDSLRYGQCAELAWLLTPQHLARLG